MPIEGAEAVVGTMQVSETTLPVLLTLKVRLPCCQMQSAVHESAVDVIDENRALRRMNGLLLLPLLLLQRPFLLRLYQR